MSEILTGPRPVSAAWPAFHERLTETLRALDEDHFLILVRKGTNRFVQFAAQGAFGMRAEVVGNAFLRGPDRLTTADIAVLGALGWEAPTSGPGVPPELDPDGSPNFFREWAHPVDHADVANAAVRALVDVLDVAHPGWLESEAFDTGGRALVLPGLGLKRAAS